MKKTQADTVLAARLEHTVGKTRIVSYHDPAFAKKVRHHVVDLGMTLTEWIDMAMKNQMERDREQEPAPTPLPF